MALGEHQSHVLGVSFSLFLTFHLRAHIPFFQIFYSLPIVLMSPFFIV